MHFGLMLMFAKVTGHFLLKSFRTEVIKYLFGHFVHIRFIHQTGRIANLLISGSQCKVKEILQLFKM